MSVAIVSHPHAAAFANAVAGGLAEAQLLARYYCGVAAAPSSLLRPALSLAGRWRRQVHNRLITDVPAERLSGSLLVEVGARGWARLTRGSRYDAMFLAHDARVALSPWPRDARAVYAYEDGALRTFRKARRLGLARIWDLPIPHWATLERMWTEEAARWPGGMGRAPRIEPAWKKARKDEELALADLIVVASRFTQESLERAGCARPILKVPYGFPVDRFQADRPPMDRPFTVLAVGSHDFRKGTPYLLEAWRRLRLPNARLRLVGGLGLSASFFAPYRDAVEHVPHMSREALAEEYARADLLAFPTLGDGFGMVIQEAMCSGIPVLTTRCGGGPECIGDGVEGWIIEERDVDALAQRIEWAAAHRDRVREMGVSARKRAEGWTWRDAGRELARAVSALASGRRG